MTQPLELIVIGTGVAGLAAAAEAGKAGIDTTMVESLFFGGLVVNVNELDGPEHGSGSDFAARMMSAALGAGARNVSGAVSSIERDGDAWSIAADSGNWRARAVVVASGARIRRLGVPGEAELDGCGVSRCADCDGPMFGGHEVVVVGGGDSAVQEATVLAGLVGTVHLVHRRGALRAAPHLVERLAACPNVVMHPDTTVLEILGDDAVRGVLACGPDGVAREIACSAVFPYVGLQPASEFVPPSIGRDADGRLRVDDAMRTGAPGLFAAGAVRAGCGGLISHAIADGIAAARSAILHLRGGSQ